MKSPIPLKLSTSSATLNAHAMKNSQLCKLLDPVSPPSPEAECVTSLYTQMATLSHAAHRVSRHAHATSGR